MTSKFAYKMKTMFKSKEQLEVEARMEFNKNKKAFQKYYNDLDGSIRNFSKMAKDAEISGNHANAKSCATFVLKLQKTQVKVQGLLQRFEMMRSMQQLTGVMTNFMTACADMGFDMDANIDLKSMWKNTAAMDKALGKLDAMSDQMDLVFETIDGGMNTSGEALPTQEEMDADAEELLNKIMGRDNIINTPVVQAQETVTAPQETQTEAAESDDTDERLRKMMQELS